MNKRGGFTLVELVVVIVALVILAGLAVIGISRYQANGRDVQRSANVGTISNALESYFTENGSYPSCRAITADATTLTATLKGLKKADLLVPGSQPNETNALRCGQKLAMAGDDFIEYRGDGTGSCKGAGDCSGYTLIYRSELDNSLKEIRSRSLMTGDNIIGVPSPSAPNNPDTLVLGVPVLTAVASSPTQVTLTWSPSSNATDKTRYLLMRATNDTFTAGVMRTGDISDTTYTFKNLTAGRAYYFKVQAISETDTSDFSNVASNIITPTSPAEVTATADSATQVRITWAASANATGYVVKYGPTEEAATFTASTKNTSLPITANLTQGSDWFFEVYATTSGVESSASSVAKVTTPINAPAAYSITSTNDGVSLTANSQAVSCPAGTTKYFAWKANDTAWVQGANYARATYSLSHGQNVSLQSATKCQKGSIASKYTPSINTVTYARPSVNVINANKCMGCK